MMQGNQDSIDQMDGSLIFCFFGGPCPCIIPGSVFSGVINGFDIWGHGGDI